MNNPNSGEVKDFTLYLHNLNNLDDLVRKIRIHFSNEGRNTFWLLKPFWRSLITTPFRLTDASSWIEKLLYIFVNPLVIYFIGALDFLLPQITAIQSWQNEIPPFLLLSIAGLLYLISVVNGFLKQIDIYDNTFDLNAFKASFPVLYEQLRVFKNTEPFSFAALNEHVLMLTSGNYEVLSNALTNMTVLTNEKDLLARRLTEVEGLLNKITIELENSKLLFDKSIAAFQALEHNNVTKDILHIFTDFALFKVKDRKLLTVAKHHTYNTPNEIDLDDPLRVDWAVVKVVDADTREGALEIDESHGRVVIANKLTIKGDTYVYSYHLPNRQFDEIASRVTEIDSQRLLYNLVLMYNKAKGGR